MKLLKQRFALACVTVAAAAVASAQTAALNPMVRVVASARIPVPADCVTIEAEAAAPAIESPSDNLATILRRLQSAAEGDDYASFKATFADARRAVDAYPPGAERNAANDALKVFADVARFWDYAMTSPTGAFFGSTDEGGSLLATAKQYPDFGPAIADETLTAGGKTLYPTRETRRFLARQSGRPLSRLGVAAPKAIAQPVVRTAVAPPERKKTPPESKAAPVPARNTSKPAKVAKAPTPPAKSTPVPKPKPPAPAPANVAAIKTAPVPTTPPVEPPVPTTTTAPPPAMATTATTPPPIDTATTATTATTDTAAPDTATTGTTAAARQQNGNVNLLLAVVLILVGIGVLIVLFRAAD
jgi:hypothetical protein